jgi:hypothetical protein
MIELSSYMRSLIELDGCDLRREPIRTLSAPNVLHKTLVYQLAIAAVRREDF